MIQQLLSTLPRLSELPDSDLASEPARGLLAECADALRLELDCPQQELSAMQRDQLCQLSDLLEGAGSGAETAGAELRAAAASAWAAIRREG